MTDAPQIYVDEANIVTLKIAVSSDKQSTFDDWQGKFSCMISSFPGFLSLEILSPIVTNPNLWVIIQRFRDVASADSWRTSLERHELIQDLQNFINKKDIDESSGSETTLQTGVTEVFITKIDPEKEDIYRKWLAKIHKAEAKFPGFRGIYVQTPIRGQSENWITFLHFDKPENLERWLSSIERQEILKEASPFIRSVEKQRLFSPYAAWFSSMAKEGKVPPLWKQSMLILLVLFPIVMLEMKFLNPFTKEMNFSLAMFISNVISVALISWVTLPLVIFIYKWWLVPQNNEIKTTFIGTLSILIIYLISILLFWNLV